MAKPTQDLLGVLKGLQSVVEASVKLQQNYLKVVWDNSNYRSLVEEILRNSNVKTNKDVSNLDDVFKTITESAERLGTVVEGVRGFTKYSTVTTALPTKTIKKNESLNDNILAKNNIKFDIKLSDKEKAILDRLDREHIKITMEKKNMKGNVERSKITEMNIVSTSLSKKEETAAFEQQHEINIPEKSSNMKEDVILSEQFNQGAVIKDDTQIYHKKETLLKTRPSLVSTAKQRKVPSTRVARMVSFGSLAAGLGLGTVTEAVKRTFGLNTSGPNSPGVDNLFLSQANMDRIVDTLCKVRGAALKIGQLLSIQDETLVSPQLSKALERVRQSADFMPTWQLEKVLREELCDDWKTHLAEFDIKPFAAASIGQVHWGKLHDGTEVAIKVQYPGVSQSVDSDIDNLIGIMKVWNIFPPGMFVDNVVKVAKRELAWEVDYIREAECTKKFRKLMKPYPDFYVPKVIDKLSSRKVFTTELVEGVPVDKCANHDVKVREFISIKMLEMVLRELLEFQFMQTDPNWSNFLYNETTNQIMLLDFGASRAYPKPFMDKYIRVINAASEDDRDTVLKISREMGFLTGYESEVMENAHVDACMAFGELFRTEKYNFDTRHMMGKLMQLVPLMLKHRLCPPPEEIYSLHRKLSGVYMLCTKMRVSLYCRELYTGMYNKYEYD